MLHAYTNISFLHVRTHLIYTITLTHNSHLHSHIHTPHTRRKKHSHLHTTLQIHTSKLPLLYTFAKQKFQRRGTDALSLPPNTDKLQMQVHITCTSHAHHMHITCTSHACHMHVTCTSHACHMHIACTMHAHHIHVTCTSCCTEREHSLGGCG